MASWLAGKKGQLAGKKGQVSFLASYKLTTASTGEKVMNSFAAPEDPDDLIEWILGLQEIAAPVDWLCLMEELNEAPIWLPDFGMPEPFLCWNIKHEHHACILVAPTRVLDGTEKSELPENIAVCTHYPDHDGQSGDWKTLLSLEWLPSSIDIHAPWFVKSRYENSTSILVRLDERGYSETIYRARDHDDAELLLEHLRQDHRNTNCRIAGPEPPGDWVISDGYGICPGQGGGLNFVLRSACQKSQREQRGKLFEVFDQSKQSRLRFHVKDGYVVKRLDAT